MNNNKKCKLWYMKVVRRANEKIRITYVIKFSVLVFPGFVNQEYKMSCSSSVLTPGSFNGLGMKTGCTSCKKIPAMGVPTQGLIQVCFDVNRSTTVEFLSGRYIGTGSDDTCKVAWTQTPLFSTSSGALKKTESFSLRLPTDNVLRMRFCSSGLCSDSETHDRNGVKVPNAVKKVLVNNVDVTELFTASLATAAPTVECMGTSCFNSSDCVIGGSSPTWTSLSDVPHGAQLLIGPIDSV